MLVLGCLDCVVECWVECLLLLVKVFGVVLVCLEESGGCVG